MSAGPVLLVLDIAADGAVRGHREADPSAPLLRAPDLAATRGDGVFETVSVGHGHPQALEAHLTRLAHSARMLDLPAPHLEGWRTAVVEAASRMAKLPEAWVKIVYSRGVEGTGIPSGWAWGQATPDHTAARTDGIRVALLDRGWSSTVAQTSPWLLAGAKTLSYAMNMASKREAARRGVDDVVFVSSDGLLLEGPTANLVLRIAGELLTPSTDLGILEGTSQGDVFRWAGAQGIPTAYRRLRADLLQEADAAWLISSVRQAAPIRLADDTVIPVDRSFSADMNTFLLARTN